MKIIVCVKQVPDTSGKVAVNPDGTLNRASMATITNPDDLNAVEAALTLKEQTGAEVVVVSMGPGLFINSLNINCPFYFTIGCFNSTSSLPCSWCGS